MYVYVIAEGPGGPCKVGYGKNPEQRLINCQIGNPRELQMMYKYPTHIPRILERYIHSDLRVHWMRGEWFNCSVDLIVEAIGRIEPHALEHKPYPWDRWYSEPESLTFEEKRGLNAPSPEFLARHPEWQRKWMKEEHDAV